MTRVTKRKNTRIRQGDIYRDIQFIESAYEKKNSLYVNKIEFPFSMVISQSCDLDQFYNNREKFDADPSKGLDKYLVSILMLPLYNLEHFKTGIHLLDIGVKMRQIAMKKTEGANLLINEIPRYHYLEFPKKIEIVDSVIDFKHYFCVSFEYLNSLRSKQYSCTISPLFREDISHRFASYLARVGLPKIKN